MAWRLQARLQNPGRVIFGSVLFPYVTTGAPRVQDVVGCGLEAAG